MKRFDQKEALVDLMVASIAYSCFLKKQKNFDCEIFFSFLSGHLTFQELSYMIFLRAIIEKETESHFYILKDKKYKDVKTFYLTAKQLDSVL